ncbi:hypothetical protein [Desulfoluna butyratoxydans]|uniref:Uncharacterized protein n=1 Tax=Desulfoluna butyratoxydans TaxID=231438 RepID=A0A4V6YUF8_9BACT|nr:hypothetical protein [Desulfoluna butyratoxydans]VFQ46928.1 hypothetical protein MSL71_46100 [Desulfoluna butyratoxydans]
MYRSLMVFFALLVSTACVSTTPAPLNLGTYDGNLALYPAVVGVYCNQGAPLEEIDIYNETFQSGYVYTYDFLIEIRFKIAVKMVGNTVDVTLVGMQHKDSDTKLWLDNNITLVFDQKGYSNKVSHAIVEILNDPNAYSSSRRDLLADLAFNYAVLKDLTDAGRGKWLDENMKGRTYELDFTLSNTIDNTAVENRRFHSDDDARYTVYLDWKPNTLFSGFSISMLTNNSKYALLKKGTPVKTRGIVLSGDSRLSLRLKEVAL